MNPNRKKHFQLQLESYVLDPTTGVNEIESLEPEEGSDVIYPSGGINMLYGKRFATEALSKAARKARDEGQILIPVVLTLSAWRPLTDKHWFDTWENKTVFDLRRIKHGPEHEGKIRALWKKYMEADGFSKAEIANMDVWKHTEYVEKFPQYIDELHKDPEFRHVDAFIWGSKEDGKAITRATLYNTKNVVGIRALTAESIEVALPRDLKEAA